MLKNRTRIRAALLFLLVLTGSGLIAATPAQAQQSATSAFAQPEPIAAPAPVPHPCGKTVDECQKANDALTEQLRQITLGYQAVRQQRDQALSQNADAQVQSYVGQQKGK